MRPFSETNAAAMRTLKTQPMPNRQCKAARNIFPEWKRETKDQQGVTNAHVLRPRCRTRILMGDAADRVRGDRISKHRSAARDGGSKILRNLRGRLGLQVRRQ